MRKRKTGKKRRVRRRKGLSGLAGAKVPGGAFASMKAKGRLWRRGHKLGGGYHREEYFGSVRERDYVLNAKRKRKSAK